MPIIRPVTKTIISSAGWGIPITDEVNRLTPLVDGTTPTVWVSATLQNGWVNNGTAYAQYRKIGDIVYLRGNVTNGANNTTAFILPVGYRPVVNTDVLTWQAMAPGYVGVWISATTGEVKLQATSGTPAYCSLVPVLFSTIN